MKGLKFTKPGHNSEKDPTPDPSVYDLGLIEKAPDDLPPGFIPQDNPNQIVC